MYVQYPSGSEVPKYWVYVGFNAGKRIMVLEIYSVFGYMDSFGMRVYRIPKVHMDLHGLFWLTAGCASLEVHAISA